jgi:Transcriptional regulators
MDIIESIKKKHSEFSKSEQKVSAYIIEHPEKIETITITKLASEAKTSTSAVLRFCQSLGFQGYKEFRFEILNYLRNRRQKANPNDLINNYLTDYTKVINQMQQIDHHQIDS